LGFTVLAAAIGLLDGIPVGYSAFISLVKKGLFKDLILRKVLVVFCKAADGIKDDCYANITGGKEFTPPNVCCVHNMSGTKKAGHGFSVLSKRSDGTEYVSEDEVDQEFNFLELVLHLICNPQVDTILIRSQDCGKTVGRLNDPNAHDGHLMKRIIEAIGVPCTISRKVSITTFPMGGMTPKDRSTEFLELVGLVRAFMETDVSLLQKSMEVRYRLWNPQVSCATITDAPSRRRGPLRD
jgi:hypothetical protein